MTEKTKYSITRGVTGVVLGAGASLLGMILLAAYTAAVGVARASHQLPSGHITDAASNAQVSSSTIC